MMSSKIMRVSTIGGRDIFPKQWSATAVVKVSPGRCNAIEPKTTVASEEFQGNKVYSFEISTQVLPHPDKVSFGGEDALFVVEDFAFGVADGVGGWREGGVNPADYSRSIMRLCSEKVSTGSDLREALDYAHSQTRLPGSCTACVVKIDRDSGKLSGLNLGDSGFVVLRDNSILTKTSPQQHYFDCPMQLAACPEYCSSTDYVRDADSLSIEMQEGDLIIMGTDGLWDNVFDKEMLRFASNKHGRKKTAGEIAEGLARLAQRNSLNTERDSPYSKAALAEGYHLSWFEKLAKAKIQKWKIQLGTLTGGKVDDITVIVAEVKRASLENIPSDTAE